MNHIWQKITGYFLRGLITLLPLIVTIWLLYTMFNFIYVFLDSFLGNFITLMLGRPIPGLGFILTLLLIFLVGYFATYIIGAQLFKLGEELLFRVPIVKSIYSAVKQINEVLFLQKNAEEYRRACMVEYPRKGIYSIGFISSDAASEIEAKANEKMINVFIPTTPTPATGFLVVVPAREVILLDMKIEEALKYVVSGGVLKPVGVPDKTPPKKEH
ncbi:MAG: DUF502 domain-containing protein [Candidatus Margulisbacteria bacterium]|nr:DUF502 domain-containing protein [Candidatus Margulisiibacteriota bacterium]